MFYYKNLALGENGMNQENLDYGNLELYGIAGEWYLIEAVMVSSSFVASFVYHVLYGRNSFIT